MDCARSTWGCHSEQSRLCKYLRPKHLYQATAKLMLCNPHNWAIMAGSFCKQTHAFQSAKLSNYDWFLLQIHSGWFIGKSTYHYKIALLWGIYLIHSTVYMFWDIDCSNSCGNNCFFKLQNRLMRQLRLDLNLCQPQNYSSNRSHNHRTTTMIKKTHAQILSIRA